MSQDAAKGLGNTFRAASPIKNKDTYKSKDEVVIVPSVCNNTVERLIGTNRH